MPLPEDLQKLCARAFQEMMNHPQHALLPLFRQQIYEALVSHCSNRKALGRLAIETARYVESFWQRAVPSNRLVEELLESAEAVLQGTMDADVAGAKADKAWSVLVEADAWQSVRVGWGELRSNILNDASQGSPSHAGMAALEALVTALGEDRWEGVLIDENTTDIDLDPWTTDPAMWASYAYAGPLWESTADAERRREFWEWWLNAAVPAAWKASCEG